MAIYMVVVFGGGSMAVFFFTWRGLGINHLAASGVPAFVWMWGSMLVYLRWTTGNWIPPKVRAAPLREVRRAIIAVVGLAGALLLFNYWPGEEPWPTVAGVTCLGASFVLEFTIEYQGRWTVRALLSSPEVGVPILGSGLVIPGVLFLLNSPFGKDLTVVLYGLYGLASVAVVVVAWKRGWLDWVN